MDDKPKEMVPTSGTPKHHRLTVTVYDKGKTSHLTKLQGTGLRVPLTLPQNLIKAVKWSGKRNHGDVYTITADIQFDPMAHNKLDDDAKAAAEALIKELFQERARQLHADRVGEFSAQYFSEGRTQVDFLDALKNLKEGSLERLHERFSGMQKSPHFALTCDLNLEGMSLKPEAAIQQLQDMSDKILEANRKGSLPSMPG